MRYEVIRLLQFVFSLSLVLGAFIGGLYFGWRRWGRPERQDEQRAARRSRLVAARAVAWERMDAAARAQDDLDGATSARPDLFAPEVDLREPVLVVRAELPPAPTPTGATA